MPNANRASVRSLARACEVTRAVCGLPAVATLDWCDRAAASLCFVGESATAVFVVCTVDPRGQITPRDAVGAARGAGIGMDDAALTGLRSRGHHLNTLGFVPEPARAVTIEPLDRLAPDWRLGPIGRLFAPPVRGELVLAYAAGESGRSMLALILSPSPASETAAVLEAAYPILVQRANDSLGPTLSSPRSWVTAREQEVLEQLTLGMSVREIAEQLGRSPHTVHDHVKALHRKLNASTRGELIARALGHVPASVHIEPKPAESAERALPVPAPHRSLAS